MSWKNIYQAKGCNEQARGRQKLKSCMFSETPEHLLRAHVQNPAPHLDPPRHSVCTHMTRFRIVDMPALIVYMYTSFFGSIASMGVCPLLAVPYSLLPGPLSPKA